MESGQQGDRAAAGNRAAAGAQYINCRGAKRNRAPICSGIFNVNKIPQYEKMESEVRESQYQGVGGGSERPEIS